MSRTLKTMKYFCKLAVNILDESTLKNDDEDLYWFIRDRFIEILNYIVEFCEIV